MSRLVMVTLLSLSLSPVLFAADPKADWPGFRGAKRDNISPDKGLLTTWPKGGPKLVWKGTGVGQGFSSVAVAGDKVFTMGDKDRASWLFALNRDTGKLEWETKVGRAGGNYSGTRCTPTVDGDYVYGIGQFGDLVCLEKATGKEVWRKNFATDFSGQSGGWNYTESPLVDGDRLVCTPGGEKATMVALDKKTGEEVWRSPFRDTAGYASAVISNAGGVKQYVQLTSQGTVGVDAKDGKLLWKNKRFAGNTANIPTPIVLGDQIFTCAGYSTGGALLSLRATNDGVEAKEEYYKRELTNKHGGVTVVGDDVYGDTDDRGQPFRANWKTGKLVWKRNGGGNGEGSASITYADGHLYIHYQDGWVALVPANGKGYVEKGGFQIPNADVNSWAHPVVIGGRLYLRDKDTVWCYDVSAR